MVLILFFLMISGVVGKGNIDTKSFWRVKPQNDIIPINFGASMAIQRSQVGRYLYVGAPHYDLSDETIPGGAVFNCTLSSTAPEVTCENVIRYEYNGSMGMTMDYNAKRKELTVCGNQHVVSCPEGNIKQRMVGSCYVDNILLYSPCAAVCPSTGRRADIMFVLDESSSVDEVELNQQFEWVKQVVENFRVDIDRRSVRVGVILFNRVPEVVVDLHVSRTFAQLSDEISNIVPRDGMGTHTGEAISLATRQFSLHQRENVAEVMIVLTDGVAQDDVSQPSQIARSSGIITLSVGVGNEIRRATLRQIAGNRAGIFQADDFSNLDSITNRLVNVIEDSTTTTLEGQNTNSSNLLSQCQAGSSLHIHDSSTYVGAFGAYDRAGSVFKYQPEPTGLTSFINETELTRLVQPVNISEFRDSYLGYSTTTGRFLRSEQVLAASGAPAYKTKGVVLIYDPDNLSSSSTGYMIHPLQSNLWQLGAYFGHTVVGADLNRDSLDELIVSAPLYTVGTNAYDQGRVFVFWNTRSNPGLGEWMSGNYTPTILSGSGASSARFGSTVVIGGDLDQNGYDDIIIGAPHEGSTPQSSGAIYVYYVTKDGVSDKRVQRIAGSNVVNSLKNFGAGLLRHQSDANDVDDNGYPDVIASATNSSDVIVLLTKPVVVVSAYFTDSTSSTIDVIKCLRNVSLPCFSLDLVINASDARKSINRFDLQIRITTDSLVQSDGKKRILFADDLSSVKIFDETTPIRVSYDVILRATSFNSLAAHEQLEITPRINVSWSLLTNQGQAISPVLEPFVSPSVVHDMSLRFNCSGTNGSCINDIVVTTSYSYSSSAEPLILADRPPPLFITINVTNNGPDPALFLLMNVSAGSLDLSGVDGNCVELLDVTSGVARLFFKFSSFSTISRFAFPKQSCHLVLSYPLERLAVDGAVDQINISGRVYSSASQSRWIDPDTTNNEFKFSRPIRYFASLDSTRRASPVSIFFNRTENSSVVGSLLDPILGGSRTNINHSFVISNTGPHGIANSTMTVTWPAWLTSSMMSPLLYLYDFKCAPSSICQCQIGETVNYLNLSQSNQSGANVSLVFPSPTEVKLRTNPNCNDVSCSKINCTIKGLRPFSVVTVELFYKLWLPTLSQPNFRSNFRSIVSVNSFQSPLSETNKVFTAETATSVSLYVPPVPPPQPSDNTIVIILGIAIGIILLVVTIAIAWKAGFFDSKYAKMKKEAEEQAADE